MISSNEASHAAQPFRFLDLPGELRNRVYGVVRSQAKRKPIGRATPYSLVKGLHPLTQTCRQIRLEFGPLSKRDAEFNVEWNDLADFTETFYGDPDSRHFAPDNLTILVDKDVTSDRDTVDVLPILDMMAKDHTKRYSVILDPQTYFTSSPAARFNRHIRLTCGHLADFLGLDSPVWWNDIRRGAFKKVEVTPCLLPPFDVSPVLGVGSTEVLTEFYKELAPQSVIEDLGDLESEQLRYVDEIGLGDSTTIDMIIECNLE